MSEEVVVEATASDPAALDEIDISRSAHSDELVVDEGVGPEPADADLSHPYSFSFIVYVSGPFGLQVDGASVFVAPENARISIWPK